MITAIARVDDQPWDFIASQPMGCKGIHTGHGFRSSSNSILNERGAPREKVIEFQLAHLETNEVKRAYSRAEYWDERVGLIRDWADICKELRDGKPAKPKNRAPDYADPI